MLKMERDKWERKYRQELRIREELKIVLDTLMRQSTYSQVELDKTKRDNVEVKKENESLKREIEELRKGTEELKSALSEEKAERNYLEEKLERMKGRGDNNRSGKSVNSSSSSVEMKERERERKERDRERKEKEKEWERKEKEKREREREKEKDGGRPSGACCSEGQADCGLLFQGTCCCR